MNEETSQKIANLERRLVGLEDAISRCESASSGLKNELRGLQQELAKTSGTDNLPETNLGSQLKAAKSEDAPPPPPESVENIIEEPAEIEAARPLVAPERVVDRSEWELDFGRVWLVRIGMVMLLTGLVFLSTYAYHNWLFNTGPAVKVGFFMGVSLAISALGVFLEKRVEKLSQYGQVLIAGGLGAGYYTIYAAHFVPSLRVINSQVLAGILLSLWAAMMLAVAVRKKSELIAVMSLGLAFYGTVVNPASALALFSSLLLSAAGMSLLLRYRWLSLGLSTLLAAYGAQAYWWGLYPQESLSETTRLVYPLCYWLLFMTFLALPQARALPEKVLRLLAGLNNGAAWALLVFSRPHFQAHENFDWISIAAGVILLGMAALARLEKVWARCLATVFGAQGLFFLTLGIMFAASGYSRFLIFAAEASVLLFAGRVYAANWLRVVSGIVFAMAILYALPTSRAGMEPWGIYLSLTLLSAAYAILLRRECAEFGQLFAIVVSGVTWAIWYFGVLDQWSVNAATLGLCLSLVAVVTLAIWVEKECYLKDLAVVSYVVTLLASFTYLEYAAILPDGLRLLSLATLAFFWWLSPRVGPLVPDKSEGKNGAQVLDWTFAAILCLALGRTVEIFKNEELWLICGGALALAGGFIGEKLKRMSLSVTSLAFHLTPFFFVHKAGLLAGYGTWLVWLPMLFLLLHFLLVDLRWKLLPREMAYFCLAPLALMAAVTPLMNYWTRPELGYVLLGLFFSGWAIWRGSQGLAWLCGLVPLLLSVFWAFSAYGQQDWLRYLPVIAALGIHAVMWLFFQEKEAFAPVRIAFFALGMGFLLLMGSLHVLAHFSGSGLTVAWAVLSGLLFGLGLLMRCRPYRLMALVVMVGAVGNVMIVDVMRLGSLGRILSFLTIGVVLLALGFLYNRYQDQIRKFL